MYSTGIYNFLNCETVLVKIGQKSSLFTTRIQVGIDECTLKLNRNRTGGLFSFRDTSADEKEITCYKIFDRLLI